VREVSSNTEELGCAKIQLERINKHTHTKNHTKIVKIHVPKLDIELKSFKNHTMSQGVFRQAQNGNDRLSHYQFDKNERTNST